MSEHKQMLADAVTRLFRAAGDAAGAAEREGWRAALWSQVEELGLPLLLVPEDQGGVGGDWGDVHAVLHAAGYYAIPLPVGESMLATHWAGAAGLELPSGATSIATDLEGELSAQSGDFRFSGTLHGVPWGRHVDTIAAVTTCEGAPHLMLLPRAAAQVHQAQNLAFEPRDRLHFDQAPVLAAACDLASLFDQCALMRVAQITGALEAALHRSIDYVKERKQFGRAIGKFQAVQQQLAVFGSEVAAVACAARAASLAASRGEAGFQIAAAKLRANMAIAIATSTAHQVHAAIGFTQEYGLRFATQRLWSWRSEFGNDRYWSERLGAQLAQRGADRFWSDLTERDDAVA